MHNALQRALNAVRTDPAFGATWNPVSIARDRGNVELAQIRFTQGDIVVEQLALHSALANMRAQPDLPSYHPGHPPDR